MRARRGVILVALAVAGASGCTEISGPLRPVGYGFTQVVRDSVTDAGGITVDGVHYPKDTVTVDTVWFSWPRSGLPVRIWADTALGLRDRVARAAGLWETILQYGEYGITMVDDSTGADVIVRSGISPLPSPSPLSLHSMAPQCFGETDITVSHPDHRKLILPIRVYVQNKYPVAQDSTGWCLDLTVAHELGHSLGLLQHSPDPSDLMYADPQVAVPSQADASTVLYIYHLQFRGKLVPYEPTAPGSIAIASGNGQTDTAGKRLALPLVVRVSDASGIAVSGTPVIFTVTTGTGSFSGQTADTVVTDVQGHASVEFTLGASAGTDSVRARTATGGLSVTFGATALPAGPGVVPPSSPACLRGLPGAPDGSGACRRPTTTTATHRARSAPANG